MAAFTGGQVHCAQKRQMSVARFILLKSVKNGREKSKGGAKKARQLQRKTLGAEATSAAIVALKSKRTEVSNPS